MFVFFLSSAFGFCTINQYLIWVFKGDLLYPHQISSNKKSCLKQMYRCHTHSHIYLYFTGSQKSTDVLDLIVSHFIQVRVFNEKGSQKQDEVLKQGCRVVLRFLTGAAIFKSRLPFFPTPIHHSKSILIFFQSFFWPPFFLKPPA